MFRRNRLYSRKSWFDLRACKNLLLRREMGDYTRCSFGPTCFRAQGVPTAMINVAMISGQIVTNYIKK